MGTGFVGFNTKGEAMGMDGEWTGIAGEAKEPPMCCVFTEGSWENMTEGEPEGNSPTKDDLLWLVEEEKEDGGDCEQEEEEEEEASSCSRHSPILLSQLSGHQGAGCTSSQSKSAVDLELSVSVSLWPTLRSCQVVGKHSSPASEPDTSGSTEKWR